MENRYFTSEPIGVVQVTNWQVIERSMFIPVMVAGAIGVATAGEPLDQGGAQGIREDHELRNQKAFALAQGQGGFASGGMNPRQI